MSTCQLPIGMQDPLTSMRPEIHVSRRLRVLSIFWRNLGRLSTGIQQLTQRTRRDFTKPASQLLMKLLHFITAYTLYNTASCLSVAIWPEGGGNCLQSRVLEYSRPRPEELFIFNRSSLFFANVQQLRVAYMDAGHYRES